MVLGVTRWVSLLDTGDGVGHMLIVVGLYTICVSEITTVSLIVSITVVVVVGESLL